MKKIYMFSLFSRLYFLLIGLIMEIALFSDILNNGANFENVSLNIVYIMSLIYFAHITWSRTIYIDKSNDRVIFRFYVRKCKNIERSLIDIKSIDMIKEGDMIFAFKIIYKYGFEEKIDYAIPNSLFVFNSQYRRIKKKLIKFNRNFK